jgi:VWFA-related protein
VKRDVAGIRGRVAKEWAKGDSPMKPRSRLNRGAWWFSAAMLLGTPTLWAQDNSAATGSQSPTDRSPAQDPEKKPVENQEVSWQDIGPTFRVRVNLVQVKVIVRDQHDKTVGNLKREDFLVYDNGKLQTISSFGVETAAAGAAETKGEAPAKVPEDGPAKAAAEKPPTAERFVAMVFDDTHLTAKDAGPARVAALKFVTELGPADRVAIYTTSGLLKQQFTNDKETLKKAVLGISPRVHNNSGVLDCPNVTYYMADQILNKSNSQAMQVVLLDTEECLHKPGGVSQAVAQAAVRRKLQEGDAENQLVYGHLEEILQRVSGMPGDRVMLLVSPGFLVSGLQTDEFAIVDDANRAGIVINTLDAQRLTTVADASSATGTSIQTMGYDTSYKLSAQSQDTSVLRDFAFGTGGTYFGNSNDLAGGMKLLGTAPDTSYELSFSPENQKPDGRFHTIKVALANKQPYAIQARNGYYAPKKTKNPDQSANQEVEEAALSQQEIGDIPLELHAQYFKTPRAAMLSVVSRLEVNGIHFRKADGRREDNLMVATVIFDENGNYVTGGEKIVALKLLDPTYEKVSRFGLTLKSSFEVKPGRYRVRQVARDSEGAQMAARNCEVEIP